MGVKVRPCEDQDLRNGVAKLRPLVYTEQFSESPETFDAGWHYSIWRWLDTHPLGGSDMHRWVLDADGQVVGFLAAVPQYYRIGGRRVVAHTPADYQVLPEYGFYALSLMRTFFRTVENCVACDHVSSAIQIETRLGAEEAVKLEYGVKLTDFSRLPRLPAAVPKSVPRTLNAGLRALDGALGAAFGGGFHVEPVEEFGEEFDRLFEKVTAAMPCVPEKDAAFLRWRYGPGSPQYPVTVLGVRGPGGEGLLGYAVLRVTAGGDNGYLLDLTTLPGRRDVARALLQAAIGHFQRAGSYIIRYRFVESPTSPRSGDIKKFGFFSRGSRRHTLLVKFADAGLHELAKKAGHWSYSIGDGEATFWVR